MPKEKRFQVVQGNTGWFEVVDTHTASRLSLSPYGGRIDLGPKDKSNIVAVCITENLAVSVAYELNMRLIDIEITRWNES